MNTSKPVIAAFDFDGTITTKDTLFDFIKFYHGKTKLLLGMIWLSPVLILFKLGFIRNDRAKQKLFSHFFKGVNINDFNLVCANYSLRIDSICKAKTLERIKWHRNQNHQVVIISASVENWIKPWALKSGLGDVLATQIEVEGDILTGRFSSPNCYGQEKVNRLKETFPNREDYTLYAYGDSRGDKELLAYADYPTLYK
ncbi:HAD-IB family hydrolase [Dysgonomonas sp. 520]|uniref:HAD-IB family hydrolase n=1 Tax=Dysgonomonas sp. 520 TaxID=2302931 RepID=UPI0013D3D1B2|nr:HAD-IB family hydrolase [Dysgonomonas sp. 520]NDW08371.1 haloacid dehalogenase-like hydrolase [Dysgonomonas sp. 520]